MTTTYSISEAAQQSGLSAHTLRWYERIGLISRVARGGDGRRRFGANDMAWLNLLVRLRSTGMPVEQMARYAALVRTGAGTEAERLEILTEHRERVKAALEAQLDCLAVIDRKIDNYRTVLCGTSGEEKQCER